MKKILFTLTIGFTFVAVPASFVHAQHPDHSVALNKIKNFRPSIRNLAALESLSFMGNYVPETKDINSKAIKDFQKRYSNIKNAMWFSNENGFVSYFVQDGFGNRAFYDKKGRWSYSFILQTEYDLPSHVRASIKSTYFDLAITQVEEVESSYGVVYIVNMENNSNIRILKVDEMGEIFTLLELVKG